MIQVQSLTKNYGKVRALDQISFDIKKGEVVGLLGLNGAGKTTCLRILTGYLIPSDGNCNVDGIDVFSNPVEIKRHIGYLPETPPLYPELSVRDFLQFISRLRGIPEASFNEELNRVCELTELKEVERTLIRNLSLGYKKRVGIAQAIIGSPPVLIFDEPVSGLDPRQIVEIRNLIRNLSGKHTVLLSSHILTEVSRTCDRVIVIHRGKLAGDISGDQLGNIENIFLDLTKKSSEAGG